jgi:hypothetical protein
MFSIPYEHLPRKSLADEPIDWIVSNKGIDNGVHCQRFAGPSDPTFEVPKEINEYSLMAEYTMSTSSTLTCALDESLAHSSLPATQPAPRHNVETYSSSSYLTPGAITEHTDWSQPSLNNANEFNSPVDSTIDVRTTRSPSISFFNELSGYPQESLDPFMCLSIGDTKRLVTTSCGGQTKSRPVASTSRNIEEKDRSKVHIYTTSVFAFQWSDAKAKT